MPIVVSLKELEPGMKLANNIINRFSVLLPHGHVLSDADIAGLKKRVPDKMVQIVDPVLDQTYEFEDTGQSHRVSTEVRRNIACVSQKVSKMVRTGTSLSSENVVGMKQTINQMMDYLQSNPVTMAVIDQSSSWDDYLQEHSANVFYLSMVIGNTIRNFIKRERERLSAAKTIHKAMNLTPLAPAALLHDIGMAPIEKFYHKSEPLTEQEIRQIQAHPDTGAEMLPDKIDPMVKLVIRCHHENQNGTGYPDGLAGEKINIFARTIRVADAFSAAVSPTKFRQPKNQIETLYEMLYGRYRPYYDPVVLKVLSKIIQPFPIGAKLLMDNDRIAVVTRHSRQDPFMPQVLVAFDAEDQPLPESDFVGPFYLDERDDIKVKAFGGKDISFINDRSQAEQEEELSEDSIRDFAEVSDLAYP